MSAILLPIRFTRDGSSPHSFYDPGRSSVAPVLLGSRRLLGEYEKAAMELRSLAWASEPIPDRFERDRTPTSCRIQHLWDTSPGRLEYVVKELAGQATVGGVLERLLCEPKGFGTRTCRRSPCAFVQSICESLP